MKVIGKIFSYVGKGQGKKALAKQIKVIGGDILDVRHLPKDVVRGWKMGARVAKSQNQSIFSGLKTRGAGVVRKGIIPHLPGVTAATTCWIPMIGATEGGYFLGVWLRKILLRKMGKIL